MVIIVVSERCQWLSEVINVIQEHVGDELTESVPKRLKTSLIIRDYQWLLVFFSGFRMAVVRS